MNLRRTITRTIKKALAKKRGSAATVRLIFNEASPPSDPNDESTYSELPVEFTFPASDINLSTNAIHRVAHGLVLNQLVLLRRGEESDDVFPLSAPQIVEAEPCFVKPAGVDDFQVCMTPGTPVDFTSQGVGIHDLRLVMVNLAPTDAFEDVTAFVHHVTEGEVVSRGLLEVQASDIIIDFDPAQSFDGMNDLRFEVNGVLYAQRRSGKDIMQFQSPIIGDAPMFRTVVAGIIHKPEIVLESD